MIKIPKGSSSQQIANILNEKEIIHSPFTFLVLSKLTGKSRNFKSGAYLFERNHYWQIMNKLEEGLTHKIKVTIPEGWNAYQIAVKLKETGIIDDAGAFSKSVKENNCEGMLFPETYFLEPMMDQESVIKDMMRLFKKNYSTEFDQRANELKMTQLQVIALASIIEREAKMDSERALISSVYHNRLKRRWLLEADPTVQYALSNGTFWKDSLTYKDLNVISPYNTYRHRGLPPGPICNPGIKSIRAALYPEETKFLFFVADGKGGHNFFTSYEKHIESQMKMGKRIRPRKQKY